MKIKGLLCLLLLGTICFAGCLNKEDVIAKIGNEKITTDNFQERLSAAPPAYQSYINTEPGRKQFVDLLVREKLILESAKQAGINKREEYKKAVSDFKDEQKRQFEEYENGLMMEMYIKEVHSNSIIAGEDEINKYYEEHKNDFEKPVAVIAKHILLPSREDAEIAMEKLKKGENFDKVAQEMSTDRVSAERGGEIGPFRKGELVPEFEEVVFNLKTGEVSDIVETPFGMHIIMKVSEQTLPAVSSDIAKTDIKKIIEKTKFENWFDESKKKFNVIVDYSKLDSIQGAGIEIEDTSSAAETEAVVPEFKGE